MTPEQADRIIELLEQIAFRMRRPAEGGVIDPAAADALRRSIELQGCGFPWPRDIAALPDEGRHCDPIEHDCDDN